MAGLEFQTKMNLAKKRMKGKSMEHAGGKTLLQPFTIANSGSRKLMHAIHRDHVFSLMNGEKAIAETGYEIRYGDLSSSIIQADSDYIVVAKISKFSFSPNHHYWLIVKDVKSNTLDVAERVCYKHITESYGYLCNNEYMDSLNVGSYIPEEQIVQKSIAFDEYNNRRDGVNMLVAYMSLDDNMEDSMNFSESGRKKMDSPLVKPVRIPMNENMIPLNLYGNDKVYKIFPDIGEEIKDSILIALRNEKKEEALYSQSVQRLRQIMTSDERRTLDGRVVDINIYCNNPANLDNLYNQQIKMYYNEQQRYCGEIVRTLMPYKSNGFKFTYALQDLFANAKRVINHNQYIEKRLYSNLIIDITVLEERHLEIGDKASNRYGGKGVVSKFIPDELMPKINGRPIDVILNSFGVYNRENIGQLFEISLTHIGHAILQYIKKGNVTPDEAFEMIFRYLHYVSPEQEEDEREFVASLSEEDKMFFLEDYVNSDAIHFSNRPMSESVSIDTISALYDEFPWITQDKLEVPITGSDGTVRFIPARRTIVAGMQYMFRLKQFAEEKFSATSLSATNLRNENTKSKDSKNFREYYSNTPIRFGNMELNNLNHMGSENVVVNLMIHSVSVQARRLVEQMYTEEPFDIDIKIDSGSRNRGAEIVMTYLKAIGLKITFNKIPKVKKQGIVMKPIKFNMLPGDMNQRNPLVFYPRKINPEEEYQKNKPVEMQNPGMGHFDEDDKRIKPGIWFDGVERKDNGEPV